MSLPALWIVMPSHGDVHPATTACLVTLAATWGGSGGSVRMLTVLGSLVQLNRDRLTHSLMVSGLGDDDIVLWFDGDMTVEPHELGRFLLRTPRGAVVGVAGRKKQPEEVWCCEVDPDQRDAEGLPEHLSHLVVGRAGGACVAVRGATLRHIYDHAPAYVSNGQRLKEVWPCKPMDVRGADGETVRILVGEDVGFGLMAADAGVRVFVDPTVTIWHHDGAQKFGGRFADSAVFSDALNNNAGTEG